MGMRISGIALEGMVQIQLGDDVTEGHVSVSLNEIFTHLGRSWTF